MVALSPSAARRASRARAVRKMRKDYRNRCFVIMLTTILMVHVIRSPPVIRTPMDWSVRMNSLNDRRFKVCSQAQVLHTHPMSRVPPLMVQPLLLFSPFSRLGTGWTKQPSQSSCRKFDLTFQMARVLNPEKIPSSLRLLCPRR